jgi:hypothetical protein
MISDVAFNMFITVSITGDHQLINGKQAFGKTGIKTTTFLPTSAFKSGG